MPYLRADNTIGHNFNVYCLLFQIFTLICTSKYKAALPYATNDNLRPLPVGLKYSLHNLSDKVYHKTLLDIISIHIRNSEVHLSSIPLTTSTPPQSSSDPCLVYLLALSDPCSSSLCSVFWFFGLAHSCSSPDAKRV